MNDGSAPYARLLDDRTAAAGIDCAIAAVLAVPVSSAAWTLIPAPPGLLLETALQAGATFAATAALWSAVAAGMEARLGWTPGKLACGLRTWTETGGRPAFRTGASRLLRKAFASGPAAVVRWRREVAANGRSASDLRHGIVVGRPRA